MIKNEVLKKLGHEIVVFEVDTIKQAYDLIGEISNLQVEIEKDDMFDAFGLTVNYAGQVDIIVSEHDLVLEMYFKNVACSKQQKDIFQLDSNFRLVPISARNYTNFDIIKINNR